MLIGGIWADEITYKAVAFECQQFKKDNNGLPNTKLNWKNISKKTLPQYKAFIDIFFKYNLQFKCIIIDRKNINLKLNKYNDDELGFYKFYYMLLRNCSSNEHEYYIYLDRRNNRSPNRLSDLKKFLKSNKAKFNKQYGRYNENGLIVKTLEFVNSDSYNLIQFSDLLMGAIGYHYNNRHILPEASEHKKEFASYIASIIKKENLVFETDQKGYKNLFLWYFRTHKQLNSKKVEVPT